MKNFNTLSQLLSIFFIQYNIDMDVEDLKISSIENFSKKIIIYINTDLSEELINKIKNFLKNTLKKSVFIEKIS